jgi:hypothetical protein
MSVFAHPHSYPRLRSRLSLWILLLATLLLSACATSRPEMMDNLDQALRGYEKAVRWAQFDAVYSFHKWEKSQPITPEYMEKIRVTRFESNGEKFDPKTKTMKRNIKLRFYNTDDQRERSVRYAQEWKYFDDTARWYLVSEPVSFNQPR